MKGLFSLLLFLGLAFAGWAKEPGVVLRDFQNGLQPLLKKYCYRCHGAKKKKSGIRVDFLDGMVADRHVKLWEGIRKQVGGEAMPPEDERQPTKAERALIAKWIDEAIIMARTRVRPKNGSVRRLTVAQYRNTLRDLLGIREDVTGVLPPDGVSKDGFVNHGQTLLLSPLLVESYFDIAERALDIAIVDERARPVIQNFRVDLGHEINPKPCPDSLILGANNHLLANDNFLVTELTAKKPFDLEPFRMRTKFRFIEGYKGNGTVRGWREFSSIYHAVFACMRGSEGYPLGAPYRVVPDGLLLRPAIPSAEQWQVESTYGPRANFKISLRELPNHGNFRVRVRAAKYDDGLLLPPGSAAAPPAKGAVTVEDLAKPRTVDISKGGIYQVDVFTAKKEKPQDLLLKIGGRQFGATRHQPAFLAVRLPAGPVEVSARYGGNAVPNSIVFTPLAEDSALAARFKKFEKRAPSLGVHLGLRRDCGSTFAPVGKPRKVPGTELREFVFEGAINNFPSPDVEKNNVNYLAGIREIGVRSEYTDGRDMPRLRIRSVEFEGPFYESWPPATHRKIFIESGHKDNSPAYAREVIRAFASRAFRRPVDAAEEASLMAVWKSSFAGSGDFKQSIKDTLLTVLTSPQFLFIIEHSASPKAEDLEPYELASKLSYFLWNTAPDERLLKLAAASALHRSLDAEIARMVADPRFGQFAREFASQWLSLEKFDVVEMDRKRFPKLTRDTRIHLRREPVELLQHLFRKNLPARHLVRSDFIMANEVVAGYYGLADKTENGFEFAPIAHRTEHLGGLLSQASVLAGLSDGREPNPVKRGAWLARKIIAEPPDDPPPNVPSIDDIDPKLSLRERLAQHRSRKACANCHAGIDPWGIPLEQFDAGGLFKTGPADARSMLPDQTKIADFAALRAYLAGDRMDRVAFSVLKHLATYATGRTLTYNELVFLEEQGVALRRNDYRMRDLIRFVIRSDIFLKK